MKKSIVSSKKAWPVLVLITMVLAIAFAEEVAYSSTVRPAADQSLLACGVLDRNSPIPIGTRCTTSKGSVYERVLRANFGETWKGPDGLIWSDRVGSITDEYNAEVICKNLGGELPSMDEFKRNEAYGFREVLPNMKNRIFWSSSVDGDPEIAYAFNGSNGDGVFDDRDYILDSVRCVGR